MAKQKQNVFQRLFSKKDLAPEENFLNENYVTGSGHSSVYLGSQSADALGTAEWYTQYNTNPRLAGLNKLVNDTGVSDYGIYIDDKVAGKTIVRNHPLQLEIDKHTVPMFFSLWTAYRNMAGEVFIAFEKGPQGPHNFKIFSTLHLSNSGSDGDYIFKYGSGTISYPRDCVVIDRDLELTNPYFRGYGRAAAIMPEITSDTLIQTYLNLFYSNSARPDVFISPKGLGDLPSEDELKNFATGLRNFHQGLENSHKTAVLSFSADIQTVPNNHMEMDLLNTRKFLRDTSIQHFSIPPEIMGIIENSNKATVVAAEHIYAKQVRLPLLTHFRDIINSKILPLYDNSEDLYFEFDDILPDEVELNINVAKEGREGQSVTINEHRALLGLPKLEGDIGNTLIGTNSGGEGTEATIVSIHPDSRDGRDFKNYYDYKQEQFNQRIDKATNGIIKSDEEKFTVIVEEE